MSGTFVQCGVIYKKPEPEAVALTDCDGNPLEPGTQMAKCSDLPGPSPTYAQVVRVDTDDPATATVFGLSLPLGTENDPTLEGQDDYLYVGTDGSLWVWDGTQYVTPDPPGAIADTPWNLQWTNTNAGGNKTSTIWRNGAIQVGDGMSNNVNFNGYFLAQGNFSARPNLFAFENTNVPNTGMSLANGGGFGNFLPVFTTRPSGNLRSVINTQAAADTGTVEPVMQFRAMQPGFVTLKNRPTYQWLNGLGRQMTMSAKGNLNIGPEAFAAGNTGQERLMVSGAVRIANPYPGVVADDTAPVPEGGGGTMIFNGTNFLGWNGTKWALLG